MMLTGTQVLVTRPEHQAENLCRLIEQQGGIAVRFPTLEIVPRGDAVEIKATLSNLDNFQWVVFISANAVNFALKANSGKIAGTKFVRFAAVGESTAQAMKKAGLSVDLLPVNGNNSEALLSMPQFEQIKGQRFLVVRGEGGREHLVDTLRSRGAEVKYLEVYKRIVPHIDISPVIKMLAQRSLDIITVTSAEALQNLSLMLGENNRQLLSSIPLVVVSERIKGAASDMGFKQITVAKSPVDTEILDAVITCVTGE